MYCKKCHEFLTKLKDTYCYFNKLKIPYIIKLYHYVRKVFSSEHMPSFKIANNHYFKFQENLQ